VTSVKMMRLVTTDRAAADADNEDDDDTVIVMTYHAVSANVLY